MTEFTRGRLQVPFRSDLKPLLQFIASRESRTPPNAATHILESVVAEMGRRLAAMDPELGVEFEKAGVRLDDGPRLEAILAEAAG